MERGDTGGSSFTDFLIRRAENLFYSAWGMFILALCLENAANYLMMQKYDGFLLSSCRTLYEILFVLFVILFPVGIAFYLRKKSFALWWIMLLLSSLIWSISDVVGFQNPYIDPSFCEEPWKRFLDTWSGLYIGSVLVQGSVMSVLYFCIRKFGEQKTVTFRTSLLQTIFVFMMSIFSLITFFILLRCI